MPAVPSTPNFRSNQILTSMLIASGGTGNFSRIMIFDTSGSADSIGAIDNAIFSTASIGQDVFLFVSGNKSSRNVIPTSGPGVAVFGGDLIASGVFFADSGARISASLVVSGNSAFGYTLPAYRTGSTFFVSGGINSALSGSNGLSEFTGDIFTSGVIVAVSGVAVGSPTSALATYSTGTWYFANVINSNVTVGEAASFTQHTIYFIPHAFETTTRIQEVSVYIVSGNSPSSGRLGIYGSSSSNDGTPDRLIFDSGLFDMSSNILKSSTVGISLKPGKYWFAMNTSASGPTGPQIRSIPAASQSPIGGLSSQLTSVTFYTTSSVFGAFPSTLGALNAAGAAAPGIAFKRAPLTL